MIPMKMGGRQFPLYLMTAILAQSCFFRFGICSILVWSPFWPWYQRASTWNCEPEVTHAHVLLVGISQPHIVHELLSIVPHLVYMRHHPTMLFCRTSPVSKFQNRWMRNSWPGEFVARGMAAACSLLLPNPVRPELKTQGETRFFFWIYYDTF